MNAAAFTGFFVFGVFVGSLVRCTSISRHWYQKGFDAGVLTLQRESVSRGYGQFLKLEHWKGVGGKRPDPNGFVWLFPNQVEQALESLRKAGTP